jgi:hypothetical protein
VRRGVIVNVASCLLSLRHVAWIFDGGQLARRESSERCCHGEVVKVRCVEARASSFADRQLRAKIINSVAKTCHLHEPDFALRSIN